MTEATASGGFAVSEPRIMARQCGGFLAVSDVVEAIKIGVTSDTEEGARAAYSTELAAWRKMLGRPEVHVMHPADLGLRDDWPALPPPKFRVAALLPANQGGDK